MKGKILKYSLPVYVISDITTTNETFNKSDIEKVFFVKKEFHPIFTYFDFSNTHKTFSESKQLVEIIRHAKSCDEHVIAICRSHHVFTEKYSFERLILQIKKAFRLGAKILYGNVIEFTDGLYLKENIFWVQRVEKASFFILYKALFDVILQHAKFGLASDSIEPLLTEITSNKFIIYPTISEPRSKELQTKAIKATSELKRIKQQTILFRQKNTHDNFFKENHPARFILNGTIKAPGAFNSANLHFSSFLKEDKIVILVPFYNAKPYLRECFNSLIHQRYQNFEIVLLDDCSTDKSGQNLPLAPVKVARFSPKFRSFALHNIVMYLKNAKHSKDDIIVIVDGDDYLYHNYVLKDINRIYQTQSCLLTYGQYYSTAKQLGHCKPYQFHEFSMLRGLGWRASHLKTFKFGLFMELLLQDPTCSSFKNHSGLFYEMTYDIALMTPLLEIAGFDNCFFNRDVNYIYRLHPGNDAARNSGLQMAIEAEIRTKPGFKRRF